MLPPGRQSAVRVRYVRVDRAALAGDRGREGDADRDYLAGGFAELFYVLHFVRICIMFCECLLETRHPFGRYLNTDTSWLNGRGANG